MKDDWQFQEHGKLIISEKNEALERLQISQEEKMLHFNSKSINICIRKRKSAES